MIARDKIRHKKILVAVILADVHRQSFHRERETNATESRRFFSMSSRQVENALPRESGFAHRRGKSARKKSERQIGIAVRERAAA
jgi:hypothetical protein